MTRLRVAVTAALLLATTGCDVTVAAVDTATPTGAPTSARTATAQLRDTAALLAQLPVKGRAPKTGYNSDTRDTLFPHWSDLDGDNCDTRAEILDRDATPGSETRDRHGCVIGATIHDPYTDTDIVEQPGRESDVDIDHVVALSDAWQKGAQQLTADQREQFANDPLNLLAVADHANQSKSDGDAATWLPPNRATRCAYVARQVAVKARYQLWVTAAERDAIARVLDGCPGGAS